MTNNKSIEGIIEDKLEVVIKKEEGGYVIGNYEYNVFTQGDTIEVAKVMFNEAFNLFIEAKIELGQLSEKILYDYEYYELVPLDLKKEYKVVGTLDFDSQTATGIIAEVNEMVFKIIAASSDKKHEISIREL